MTNFWKRHTDTWIVRLHLVLWKNEQWGDFLGLLKEREAMDIVLLNQKKKTSLNLLPMALFPAPGYQLFVFWITQVTLRYQHKPSVALASLAWKHPRWHEILYLICSINISFHLKVLRWDQHKACHYSKCTNMRVENGSEKLSFKFSG